LEYLKGKEGKKLNPTARSTLPSPIRSTTVRKASNFSTKTILKVEEGQRLTIVCRWNEKGFFPLNEKTPFSPNR